MAACGLAAATSTFSQAGALSCALPVDGSPVAIALGNGDPRPGNGFFDRFDFAVVGTVTEIGTAAERDPTYGTTAIHLDVVAILGEEPASERLEISSPDPGEMAGYPYEVDVTYFIPVQSRGPGGEPNYSFACDPIVEVDASIAMDLENAASSADVPFSTPDKAATPKAESAAPEPASPASDSTQPANNAGASRLRSVALILAVIGGAAATITYLVRRAPS